MIKTIIYSVIFFILGGLISGLSSWGYHAVKMSNLESDKNKAVAEKLVIKEQWQAAVTKLASTTVLLNDTLAAIEVLKEYKSIDKGTRDDINKIDKTLDNDGDITDETIDEFRKMMEEFNQLQGRIGTSANEYEENILDITPFNVLHENAENLFKKATELVFEVKNEI